MENENIDSTLLEEDDNQEEHASKKEYPSAQFLVDACFQDYMRLQENYNKLYEKLNVALAFAGVVLTLVLGTLDFKPVLVDVTGLKIWEVILLIAHALCAIGSLILLFYGTIRFLTLLKGKSILVFKSEDVRNDEVYREEEQNAAMWLIDKYTKCVHELRPIIADKQKVFEKALKTVIIGLILYTVALTLGKVGF